MKLSARELILFAELWSVLRVSGRQAAKIMQTTITRRQRNRHKGKKKRTRATAGR